LRTNNKGNNVQRVSFYGTTSYCPAAASSCDQRARLPARCTIKVSDKSLLKQLICFVKKKVFKIKKKEESSDIYELKIITKICL
jgi:hypothetical protein